MSMIHEIMASVPRHKRSQRKGRGRSSNRGKTCGRGGKGSSARQGSPHWVPGHEGGQTKLFQRFPKRGFSNDDFARRFYTVNISQLSRFENGSTVDSSALIEAGLIPDDKQPVKILGDGELGKKLTIMAGWYSKSALEKITKAGGSAQTLKGEAFEFPKPKKKFIPREHAAKKSKKAEAAEEGAELAKAPDKPAEKTSEKAPPDAPKPE
jgi:large subunit ribosomal protein L15